MESVAEHCVGMMIVLAKHMRKADIAVRSGDWNARNRLIGAELLGKTLGVVGFGRIGQRVAEICRQAFFMDIIYYDVTAYPEAEKKLDAKKLLLSELLEKSDFVSVHAPLLPATKGLIGEPEIKKMKPHAFLINTSRGPLIDESALIRALREKWIAGAGLDVYDPEPPFAENPLFNMDNVIVSPHMAAHTDEAMLRMAMVADDVIAVIEGKKPKNPVQFKK